mmetsp:Transcript_97339/g.168646  ORF Transcript_97339/g.168646 Transcript_97339/m.168646 type:complete len:396 (+) Transcript_97339:97-1284(+)
MSQSSAKPATSEYGTMEGTKSPRGGRASIAGIKPRIFQTNVGGDDRPYDINDLITLRVFGQWHGTVFGSKNLWYETFIMAVFYWTILGIFIAVRWDGFSSFMGKESSVRAFIAMFSTLIGLLLSFYTALNLGRWWQMRQLVHVITESCKQLVMYLASGVTKDGPLIDRIQRYSRASLFLIFAANGYARHGGAKPMEAVKERDFLTQDEVDKLIACCPDKVYIQSETLWVWLANAISRLNDQGLTKGPPHYCMLMQCVEHGRAAVADVQAYLETPIPKGYVHLLCLMVKMHNFILTALMALACVMLTDKGGEFHGVGVFRTTFRAFFMPFLYNAILILNSQVTDPFGFDAIDFPFEQYSIDMKESADSFFEATINVPDELSGRKRYEKVFINPESP